MKLIIIGYDFNPENQYSFFPYEIAELIPDLESSSIPVQYYPSSEEYAKVHGIQYGLGSGDELENALREQTKNNILIFTSFGQKTDLNSYPDKELSQTRLLFRLCNSDDIPRDMDRSVFYFGLKSGAKREIERQVFSNISEFSSRLIGRELLPSLLNSFLSERLQLSSNNLGENTTI